MRPPTNALGNELLAPWPFPEIALPPWLMVAATHPLNRSPNGRNTVAVLVEESGGAVLKDPDTYALVQFALIYTESTPWRQTLWSCCHYDNEQAERIAAKLVAERQFRETMEGAH